MSKHDKPNHDRRKLLRHGSVAAGGLAVFAAGYSDTLSNAVKGFTQGSTAAGGLAVFAAGYKDTVTNAVKGLSQGSA